jgi:hypothetical protein
VLNKVMVIRSTVKPREKSLEEFSEDRQAPPTPVVNALPVAAPPAVAGTAATATNAAAAPDEPDCCGAPQADPTDDAQLPAASGGVAS